MNGVFWLRSVNPVGRGKVQIQNWNDVGKIKVEQVDTVIEDELVFQLLRGRDVHRWTARPSTHILLTQDPRTRVGIADNTMKRQYHLTYQYLKHFEKALRGRSGYKKYFDPQKDPFWTIYNVGPSTMAPYRVVFKELTDFFQSAAVLSTSGKPFVPDTKLRFIECRSKNEAYFLSGLLNSSPAVLYLYATATWVQTADYQASDISRLAIPDFANSNETHRRIALASEKCHAAAQRDDDSTVYALEKEIDGQVADLWGITTREMKSMRSALYDLGRKNKGSEDCGESDEVDQ